MATPATESRLKAWETATGHIADVLTQMIGLSSVTLALVVTFRVQLEGGPSWVLKIAFASFACCIAGALVAKTTIYLSHVQLIEPRKEAGFARAPPVPAGWV